MPRWLLVASIIFGVVLIAVAALVLLARRPSKTPSKTGRPVDGESIKLTLWQSSDSIELYKQIVAEYRKENPGIEVKVEYKNPETFRQDTVDALAIGQGPDIWLIDQRWLPKEIDKLVPAPDQALDQDNVLYVKNNFAPVVAQDLIAQDKVWGLPAYLDTLAVLVNQNILAETLRELKRSNTPLKDETPLTLGPRTWEEFIGLVRLTTKRQGDQIERSGAALGTANNVRWAPEILAALMLQNETIVVSPDKLTAGFNLPRQKVGGTLFYPGANALEFYTNFAQPSKSFYSWNEQMPSDFEAFVQGQVAMVFGFEDDVHQLGQDFPTFDFRVVPLPQVNGALKPIDLARYSAFVVTNNSKQPQAAWDFIKFLTGQGSDFYSESSGRPSAKAAKQLPNIVNRIRAGDPFRFQGASAKSWYRGKSPQYFEDQFRQMIQDVLAGAPIDAALDKAAKLSSERFRFEAGFAPQPIDEGDPLTNPSTSVSPSS